MNAFNLHLVRVRGERRDKPIHVHQRHQRNVKPNQAIVVILAYVLELFLMACVQGDKITSAVQGCHSRRTSVQLLEENVEMFVVVRWRFLHGYCPSQYNSIKCCPQTSSNTTS